jgi:hypothetical protein
MPPEHPTVGAVPGGAVDVHAYMIGSAEGLVFRLDPSVDYTAAGNAGLGLADGYLTLPDCRLTSDFGGSWPFEVTVQATRGATGPVVWQITFVVDERLLSSAVACYILQGETLCRDPANGYIVETGTTLQIYALTKATCTSTYTPPLPAGACPAGDPNFDFCR